MKYIIVNDRLPVHKDGYPRRCSFCLDELADGYLREHQTRLLYCSTECYSGHCEATIIALGGVADAEIAKTVRALPNNPFRASTTLLPKPTIL